MRGDTIRLVLQNLQPRRGSAWHGGPTPVGAVRGVTAAQARWVPSPGRHSIWSLSLHIAYWKYAVRRHLTDGPVPRFPRSPANFPRVPQPADNAAWQADRALLAAEHGLLLAALAKLDPGELNRRPPGGKRWTYGEIIVGVLVHDAYHTGQVQMLKRLYDGRP